MAPLLPFAGLIASGVGAATAIGSGIAANNRNNAVLGQVNGQNAQQQALIKQLMDGIDKNAYMQQAQGAGQQALGQLSADDASRGLLNSGAHARVGAQTISDIYQQANAKYQTDRQNALGIAMGAHQSLADAYSKQFNPDPYSGVGDAFKGIGTASASYLDYLKPPAKTG